jgi:hypothetical protein
MVFFVHLCIFCLKLKSQFGQSFVNSERNCFYCVARSINVFKGLKLTIWFDISSLT